MSSLKKLCELNKMGAISNEQVMKAMGVDYNITTSSSDTITTGSLITNGSPTITGDVIINGDQVTTGIINPTYITDHTTYFDPNQNHNHHYPRVYATDTTFSFPPITQYPKPDGEEIGILSLEGDDLVLTDRNNKKTIIGKLNGGDDFIPIEVVVAKKKLLEGSENEAQDANKES